MGALVSVIIPAYNAAKTLPRMIRCVREQTYENLQIVLVNDGSKDRTGEIMRVAAEEDPRILVIEKENGGVGSARNAGLDAATGKYVCFFDADDAVPPRAIARMVRVAKTTHADLVIGKVKFMNREEKLVTASSDRLGDRERIGRYNRSLIGSLSVWNKMFRRDRIEEHAIRFNDTKRGEDSVFFFRYWYYCRHIAGCHFVVYHYEKRKIRGKKSLSQKLTMRALREMHSNYRQILELINQAIEEDTKKLDEITDMDEQEKDGHRESFLTFRSLLCKKAILTIVNKYYRLIPEPSQTRRETAERMIRRYRRQMLAQDWEEIVEKNSDILSEEGHLG